MQYSHGIGLSNIGWKKVLFGSCVGMLVMLAIAAGAAWLMQSEMMEEDASDVVSLMMLLCGGLFGSLSSGTGEGRAVRCMLVAVGLMLALLLINLILCDGTVMGAGPGGLALFAGAGAAALIGGAGKSGRRRKKKYARYRNR